MTTYRKESPDAIRARHTQRVENATRSIVDRFERGDLPAALAPIFIHRHDDIPCRRWSWSNQIITALAGHDDARTYRDWQRVGRQVRKAEHAFYILEPIRRTATETDKETGEEKRRTWCAGFKAGARFGYEQTEGEELPDRVAEREFIDALPLVDVARTWGLRLQTFGNAERIGQAGWFAHDGETGKAIGLGVENLSTWTHELVHSADLRCGALTTKTPKRQELSNEVVAEVGGATLLLLIGKPTDADLGGCFDYVRNYCDREDKKPERVCMQLLERSHLLCSGISASLEETFAIFRSNVA